MIRVLTDQNCVGVPPAKARLAGRRLIANIARETITRADWTTHDYNVHFLINLANDGVTDEVVEISVNGGIFDTLPEVAPQLHTAAKIDGPWVPADFDARTDGQTRYAIQASVPAGRELHIANTLPRPLDPIIAETRRLCEKAGGRLLTYGNSLEGRPLLAVQVGEPSGTPVLISSGFHPPEPDTLATLAIIEWLATEQGKAASADYQLTIIPVANPDGYARATQGSNADGINMYWHFAQELPEQCPEASSLWELAVRLKPRGYIDFHCYTFQLAKSPGPYVRPLRYYQDPDIQAAARQLYDGLAEEKGVEAVTGFPAFAPHTLGSMLAKRFQTLTLAKYHLHLKEGIENTQKHGVRVLTQMLDALNSNEISSVAPDAYSFGREWIYKAGEVWSGLVRPQLGLMRRGKFSEIRLDRTAQIAP